MCSLVPTARLRSDAKGVFLAAVKAADPRDAVSRALTEHGDSSSVTEQVLRGARRVFLVAVGKAACAMSEAAVAVLPHGVLARGSLAVVNRDNQREVAGVEVIASGHPLPDEAGVRAAHRVRELLARLSPDDLVLVLISGGGSALLPAPADGITLADKLQTTDLLLSSGAAIGEVNTVRKHLSFLKGGGMASLASPARVEALILSDVIGDDLSTIASGPTVADPTTFADARAVLERYGLWTRVPSSVRSRITNGDLGGLPETLKPGHPALARVTNRIVGSNAQSLDAAVTEARRLGYRVSVASRHLEGEARDAASWLAGFLHQPQASRNAVLAGGETTVTVKGHGRGGRNQELALAFALSAETRDALWNWAFLSGGTDGKDGPTDAAGGIVDTETLRRARQAGLDPSGCLEQNDAYTLLEATGDLLRTGGTETNVADLQILLQ